MTDKGVVTEYRDGVLESNTLTMVADSRQPDGTRQLQRMSFENLGPDRVRQSGATSRDGGKSWTPSFDLIYQRKK